MENHTQKEPQPRLFQRAEILFSNILLLEREVEILEEADLTEKWKEKNKELQEFKERFTNLFPKEVLL